MQTSSMRDGVSRCECTSKKSRQAEKGRRVWLLGLRRELLKRDFAAELNNAARPGAGNLAEVQIPQRCIDRILTRATSGLRDGIDSILRVVKGIERFHAELETDPFGELECLCPFQRPSC